MNNEEFKCYLLRLNMTTNQLADTLNLEVNTLYQYSSKSEFPEKILIMMRLLEENHDLKQLNRMLMKQLGLKEPVIHNSKSSTDTSTKANT
jgi:hypothetical protein